MHLLKQFKLLTILFGIIFSRSVIASDLIDVYQKTLAFDPSLKQAEAARLSALQTSPQATARLFPTINFQANVQNNNQKFNYDNKDYPDSSDKYRSYVIGLNLRQSLINLSNLNKLKQADVSIALAEIQFATYYQDLMYRIILSYLEFLAANDGLSQFLVEKDLTETFLSQVVAKFKKGEVAVVDTHDVQARYDSVITDMNFASMRVEAAREALRKLTGEYFISLSQLRNDIPFLYPEPADAEWWVRQALSENYALLSSQLTIQASQLNLSYQKSFNLPTLDLVGNYSIYNNTDLPVVGGEATGSTIALELNWNLYQGGLNSSYITQSRYNLTQTKMNQSSIQIEVEEQIRGSYFLIYSEINRINDFRRAIISHQQALRANQVAYEVKARSIRDLLISIEQLSKINRDYAQARYNYLIQFVMLHKIAGMLDEPFIKKINALLGG